MVLGLFRSVLGLSFCAFLVVVRTDYPPPSEHGYEYYAASSYGTNNNNNGGSILRPGTSGADGIGGRSVSFVEGWNTKDWSGLVTQNHVKCVNIPSNLTLCQDIGYKEMRLPNLLQHTTMKEVMQQASIWVRLTKVRCHPDAQIFLCSLFAPICLDEPVYPCRTLCEEVKNGCESTILRFGYPWPEMLQCDQFPSDTDLCIGSPRHRQEKGGDRSGTVCPVCSRPSSDESIRESLCKADFVMRIKVEQSVVVGRDKKIVYSKKKKTFRSVLAKAKKLRDGNMFIDGGASCHCPALERDGLPRNESLQVVVAGSRTRDRLVLSLLQPVNGLSSKGLRRALIDIRRNDVCNDSDTTQTPRTQTNSGKPETGEKKKTGQRSKVPSAGDVGQSPPVKDPSRSRPKDSNVSERKPISSDKSSQRKQGKERSKEGKQERDKTTIAADAIRSTKKPRSKKSGQQN